VRPLLLATRNAHKTREFAEILGPDFEVRDLTRTDLAAVEENGRTFEDNAALKALAVANVVDDLVISDDSGLEVAALNGAPGIYSARFGGENATDEENVAKLLDALASTDERTARFVCVIAIAERGKLLATFSGIVEGSIAYEVRGPHGFGYDPIFIPNGHDQTFAMLPSRLKNQISHRAGAVAQLRKYLRVNATA
jgi:XTP/dITP diphosphohydrolase